MRTAEELGIDADVVLYMKTPPDAATLGGIIDKLEGPVTDLVRRDSAFARLGLSEGDVQSRAQVVAVLVKHKALLQRPIVVTASRAIVGRPKSRVHDLLAALE